MATEAWALLRHDHEELEHALRVLVECNWPESELRWTLDGMRASFGAHAEAEAAVLRRVIADPRTPAALHTLVSHVVAAHVTQQAVLDALVEARPGTVAWRELVTQLRTLMLEHDLNERRMMPALRKLLAPAAHAALEASYAVARHQMLGMMQAGVAPRAAPELQLD